MERIQLNEDTFWAGGPYDPTNPGGAEALPEIQRLLFAGDVEKAHDLFGRTMMGIPRYMTTAIPTMATVIGIHDIETSPSG